MLTAPASVLPPPAAIPPPAPTAASHPAPTPRAHSLVAALAAVPDHRGRRGLQIPFLPLLLSVVYACLCGQFRPAAIAEWVQAHYADWLHETLGFLPAAPCPCRTTYFLFLRGLDWLALETVLSAWIAEVATAQGWDLREEPLAFDGKEVRGMRRMGAEALLLISAFTHASGFTLALRACPEGGEQAAVRALLQELALTGALAGRVITADALHTQRETCQTICDSGADYVLPVKGNQEQLQQEIQARLAPWKRAGQDRECASTTNTGHGRSEMRALVAVSLPAGGTAGIDWPGAQQVFCLTRTVTHRKSRKTTFETVWGITSLPREAAGAARLLALNRGHWGIENRSHWVRDVVGGEDAGLAWLDHTAEVLAVLRTTMLNLLRAHHVPNVARQFRANAHRAKDAAYFLGLAPPRPVL